MAYATANGIRQHFEIEGDGPTVLLLHAVGIDLSWWEPQVRVLREEFRVLRVDLRGHGESEVPPGPYRLDDFAADVHGLLDVLGLSPAHVVGLSMGGMIAQALAIDYPADVRSLVLAGTACTFGPEVRTAMAARGEAAEASGMVAVAQPTLERWFTASFMGSDMVLRCRQRLLSDDVAGWAASWRAISRLDTHPRLSEISVPTLVITGEADASTPPPVAQVIADRIPGAALEVLPGAPHMAPFERPELFNPPVFAFLRKASR